MSEEAMVALVRGKLESMRELSALLKKRGIQSEIRKPGGGGSCDTG